MAEKLVYFLSDAHLGSRAIGDPRAHERKLVSFLDSIKDKAAAIYLLGDMFDFWFEYRTVVPKGHVRFLGKIAEIADSGVEVHFFAGNHDMWTFGYLADELGINVNTKPMETEILGKRFFLAHGDGLNDNKMSVRIIQSIFHSKALQFLFKMLPPYIGLNFGYTWSKSNRNKHDNEDCGYMGEDKEPLVLFAKKHALKHDVDFYLFGHRHILLDLPMERSRVVILGDWFREFSYATFDGSEFLIHHYE